MEESLKEIRKRLGYTQSQAAALLKVSLRSYKSYENEPEKFGTLKYAYMVETLQKQALIDEEHGLLTVEEIKKICAEVFQDYDVEYCFLFGSYAKELAKPNSDVDLLISSTVKGLKFYGLIDKLSSELRKKVDLLDMDQLVNNPELLNEVLRDGVKIYG